MKTVKLPLSTKQDLFILPSCTATYVHYMVLKQHIIKHDVLCSVDCMII